MQNILKKFPTDTDEPKDFVQQKYVTFQHPAEESHKPIKPVVKKKAHTVIFSNPQVKPKFQLKNYLIQIPTLTLGLLSYFTSYLILKNVQPAAIQNVFIPNFYLPLLITVGLGNFFTSWYVLQNARRSLFISVALTLLLILRIQHLWSETWIVGVVLPFLCAELLLTYKSFRR